MVKLLKRKSHSDSSPTSPTEGSFPAQGQLPMMRNEVMPSRVVRVQVPASSANVGAAFDAAALALHLYDEVTLRLSPTGPVSVDIEGYGSTSLPRDATHLVVAAVLEQAHTLGFATPGVHLQCRNRIPQGKGLGSSAAAVVAGLVAAWALLEPDQLTTPDLAQEATSQLAFSGVGEGVMQFSPFSTVAQHILQAATRWEGHADNVAACLFGGLVAVSNNQQETTPTQPEQPGSANFPWQAVNLPVSEKVRAALFVPQSNLATSQARQALPPRVPLSDATSNVSAALLLAPALTVRPDLLKAATADRLHQQYRASLMPESAELVGCLRQQGYAAFISGAGPTVAVLGHDLLGLPQAPAGFQRHDVAVSHGGATVQVIAGQGL